MRGAEVIEISSTGYPEPSEITYRVTWPNGDCWDYDVPGYLARKARAAYKKHKSVLKWAAALKSAALRERNVRRGTPGDVPRTAAYELIELPQRSVALHTAMPVLWHGTLGGFEAFEHDRSGLGTHFGTWDAADQRLRRPENEWEDDDASRYDDLCTTCNPDDPDPECNECHGEGYVRLEPTEFEYADEVPAGAEFRKYDVNVQNPLRMVDVGRWNDVRAVAAALRAAGRFGMDDEERVLQLRQVDAWAYIRRALEAQGFDSIVYRNTVEDIGVDSYIVWDNSKLTRLARTAAGPELTERLVRRWPQHEAGIRELAANDPTGDLRWLDWGTRQLRAGQPASEVTALLRDAFAHRDKFEPTQYPNLAAAREALGEAVAAPATAGSEVVYQSDGWTVTRTVDRDALCSWVPNRPWCVTWDDPHHWNQYTADEPWGFWFITGPSGGSPYLLYKGTAKPDELKNRGNVTPPTDDPVWQVLDAADLAFDEGATGQNNEARLAAWWAQFNESVAYYLAPDNPAPYNLTDAGWTYLGGYLIPLGPNGVAGLVDDIANYASDAFATRQESLDDLAVAGQVDADDTATGYARSYFFDDLHAAGALPIDRETSSALQQIILTPAFLAGASSQTLEDLLARSRNPVHDFDLDYADVEHPDVLAMFARRTADDILDILIDCGEWIGVLVDAKLDSFIEPLIASGKTDDELAAWADAQTGEEVLYADIVSAHLGEFERLLGEGNGEDDAGVSTADRDGSLVNEPTQGRQRVTANEIADGQRFAARRVDDVLEGARSAHGMFVFGGVGHAREYSNQHCVRQHVAVSAAGDDSDETPTVPGAPEFDVDPYASTLVPRSDALTPSTPAAADVGSYEALPVPAPEGPVGEHNRVTLAYDRLMQPGIDPDTDVYEYTLRRFAPELWEDYRERLRRDPVLLAQYNDYYRGRRRPQSVPRERFTGSRQAHTGRVTARDVCATRDQLPAGSERFKGDAARLEALEQAALSAYEAGDFDRAEDLDAEYAELADRLEAAHSELMIDPGADWDDLGGGAPEDLPYDFAQLWDRYTYGAKHDLLTGDVTKTAHALRELVLRYHGDPSGTSDARLLVAARDAWRRIVSLRQRRHAADDKQPWVAVDLDGTLLDETSPKSVPESGGVSFGAPLPGAAEAMQELVALGWRVSIYTARFGDEAMPDDEVERLAALISERLNQHNIVHTDVWVGRKPRAHAFVDNRAIAFDGDWPAVIEELVAGPLAT